MLSAWYLCAELQALYVVTSIMSSELWNFGDDYADQQASSLSVQSPAAANTEGEAPLPAVRLGLGSRPPKGVQLLQREVARLKQENATLRQETAVLQLQNQDLSNELKAALRLSQECAKEIRQLRGSRP